MPAALAAQPATYANEQPRPLDPSKLKLLHRKTGGGGGAARPFVPAPGINVLAEQREGEWGGGRITATSRAMDGSERFVVKFDGDGATMHLPPSKLKRAAATPRGVQHN